MPQSILAFLAMMLATLASLNQYRAQLKSYDEMVLAEFQMMANAVALERMEIIDLNTDWADLETVDGDTTNAQFEIAGANISFELTSAVQYVDDYGVPSGTPTTIKEVAITATNDRFKFPMVIHRRLFAQ